MNFIDYLIYTTNTSNVRNNFPPILSDYIHGMAIPGEPGSDETPIVLPGPLPALANITSNYPLNVIESFVFYQDSFVIDKAIQKHWYDINNGPISPIIGGPQIFTATDAPPYHLIFAYLLENTKMFQIFEKLLFLYMNDEVLGVASSNNITHQQAFQWMVNTENLFFKYLSNNNFRNITSTFRSNEENVRRNAYHRLFGMDLAFDSSNGNQYFKAKSINNDFIPIFEQFLSEVWQAYINARNSSGANTTDYQKLIDMVTKLRERLLARRGANGNISNQFYRFMNLSKEEYSSVGLFSWLYFIVSYDSPLVNFLGCQANTASDRLKKIGSRVNIEAHSNSQALLDLSIPSATILRDIEYGTLEAGNWLQLAIESQTPTGAPLASVAQTQALNDLLTIINNWEKATGHKIKNPEANITGSVTLQPSNGVRTSQNGMPKPVLN